jgi:hypothetical protein
MYGDDVILSIFAGRIRIKKIFLLVVLTLTFFVAPAFAITIRNVVCTAEVNCSPAIQHQIDISAPGDQILLPAGRWLVDSAILVNKSVHIAGKGRASYQLYHNRNIGLAGSGGIFHLDGDDITMAHFTIAAEKPGMLLRTTAIRIRGNNRNIAIVDMGFRDITSSAILAQGNNINNVTITGCVADEYYEQFVELASTGSNYVVSYNFAKTTSGHPNLGSTEPFGIILTPGLSPGGGLIEDVFVRHNVIDHSAMGLERTNTQGFRASDDGKALGRSFAVDNLHLVGNTFTGQGRGIDIVTLQNNLSSQGRVFIDGNAFVNLVNEPIRIAAQATCTVRITDNHIYRRVSWGPYKLQQGANVVVLKSGNLCYQDINKLAASPCN